MYECEVSASLTVSMGFAGFGLRGLVYVSLLVFCHAGHGVTWLARPLPAPVGRD